MAGYRFWMHCSLAVLVALTMVQVGRSQAQPPPPPVFGQEFNKGTVFNETDPSEKSRVKVYSLADLGDDPKLCAWVAETISHVIAPGSWANDWKGYRPDGARLSYYAPGKVLVINHTSAVHAQVDAFLTSLKKSLPAKRDPQVMQAQFVPDARPIGPVTASQAYPVPYPPSAPKHLFHFIIRYEGDGVIDANVVKFAKALSQEAAKGASGSVEANLVPTTPNKEFMLQTTNGPIKLQYKDEPQGTSSAPIPFPAAPIIVGPGNWSREPTGPSVPPAPSRPLMPPADPAPSVLPPPPF